MSRGAYRLVDSGLLPDTSLEMSNSSATKLQAGRFCQLFDIWYERSKQRRQLLELADDAHLLKDLGLSNYDLRHEGRKKFWRR